MYGVVFDFLRDYVAEYQGDQSSWHRILRANNYSQYKIFFPVGEYPDNEFISLAKSVAETLNSRLSWALEEFGSYVGHRLVEFYPMYFKRPGKRTFDIVIESSEKIRHAIRSSSPTRTPPYLSANLRSQTELSIHYQSKQQLCSMVKGMLRGLGEYYQETLRIHESKCMLQGAEECVIHVTQHSRILTDANSF